MNIEEARLYLEHTSKEDFNLEKWQKENRYQAIQVVLEEIERLNNIINKAIEYGEKYLPNYDFDHTNLQKLLEILKGEQDENNSSSK